MEEVTEGVNNLHITASDSYKKNRIQVSNTKKPLFFYVNLAKRYMQQHNEVELSALGMGSWHGQKLLFCPIDEGTQNTSRHMKWVSITNLPEFYELHQVAAFLEYVAIATVVTIAEILKNNGLAVERKITTSTVDINDESRGRPIQKAKIEILLGKTENFDELMAAAAEERELADGEEQS
ncbi:hypothetical protein ZIOFF_050592 [Zingiber officinale]|uniref:Alba DNA/RNA-binding protein n=1 Tax=Zingiber officinale TaxID=94328 RepID=A0A8J5FLE4_ZINOF|nr:hypothetical protein ZIOFF_050592 [Zingiber officinale]